MPAVCRYPNGHPLAGSTRVNISLADLARHPRFSQASLSEAVIGPGDTLYLPSWWWHQFEQPFEGPGALNMWTRELTPRTGSSVPHVVERDSRMREHSMFDFMERAVTELFGNKFGVVLDGLALRFAADGGEQLLPQEEVLLHNKANDTLHNVASQWRQWVSKLPGSHAKASHSDTELVGEFLEASYRDLLGETQWPKWSPGIAWDLSHQALLEPELAARCKPAAASATYTSVCTRS